MNPVRILGIILCRVHVITGVYIRYIRNDPLVIRRSIHGLAPFLNVFLLYRMKLGRFLYFIRHSALAICLIGISM